MFVESVLRYGLPVNFQGMILLPQKKTQKKLRDSLNQLYTHLDSAGGSGDVSFEFVEYTYVVTCFNSSASRNLKNLEIQKMCALFLISKLKQPFQVLSLR